LDELREILHRLGSDLELREIARILLEIAQEKTPHPKSALGTWILQLALDVRKD
jgi:hypothetical protein